jgi:hypothetical protein
VGVADQGELFNSRRYSPVSVAVYLRLPEANARSFAVASALGRFIRLDGSFGSVRSVSDAGGSVVGPTQRQRVLAVLNIQPRRWRSLVTDWEARYVAHRCAHDTVTLFVQPLEKACPACRAPIAFSNMPPAPDARRHESGTSTTAEAALVRPQSGSNTTARGVPTGPLFVAASVHPKSGVLQGEEVGGVKKEERERSDLQAVDLLDPVRSRDAQKTAPPLDEIQTAALIGDWSEVECLAEILGWAKVVDLARRAGDDLEAADMVRRKVGIAHAS